MATTLPLRCHASTMRILFSGETRANTAMCPIRWSSSLSGMASNSGPTSAISPPRKCQSALRSPSPSLYDPRNHDRSDSRPLRICYSRRRLCARRVDHRHKPKKNVITLPEIVSFSPPSIPGKQKPAHEAPPRKIFDSALKSPYGLPPSSAGCPASPKIDRALQKDVRRPFGQQCRYTVQRIDRAHQLAVRIKRQFLLSFHCSP